jgi:Fibronectin type III domain
VTGILADAISLAWNDNSDNEQGFIVGWWEYGVTTSWNYVALPANQNFFLLTGLVPGAQYAFIVEAYNAAGYSAWSNQVNQYTHSTFP